MRILQSAAVVALSLALLAPGLAAAGNGQSDGIGLALDYLRSRQGMDGGIGTGSGVEAASAWSAIAFARAGVDCGTVRLPGGAPLIHYVLATTSPDNLLSLVRQVLALVACGADPRSAAGFDAVAAIEAAYDGVQLGDPTYLSDDIFGLQALAAAGVPASSPVVAGVRAHLLAHQQASGAWGFEPASPQSPNLAFNLLFADVDLTSQAIVALRATQHAGDAAGDVAIARGLGFLKLGQSLDGGCQWSVLQPAAYAAFDPIGLATAPAAGTASNGASTSWALMALAATGEEPQGPRWRSPTGADMVTYLAGLQQPDGHFVYQHGVPLFQGDEVMTAHAVVGLSGHTFVG